MDRRGADAQAARRAGADRSCAPRRATSQLHQVAGRSRQSSNNSLLADAKGNIAYLMPQFVPRRDNRFD